MQDQGFKSLRQLSASDKEFCFEMISHITSNLDLTETQLSQLKTAYRAIGSYLANQGGKLAECHIYAQGSVGIGTSVKPIDEDSDMDIDLVLHLPSQHYPTTTDEANELLFNLIRVLKDSQRYGNKIENMPKRRCVTLQYGGIEGQGFHMDITPSMPEDMDSPNHKSKVRVADIKDANSPSHPYGYRKWFRSACSKEIRWNRKSNYRSNNDIYAGTVEPLPGQGQKTVLQIVVQLLKRHRDMWKQNKQNVYGDCAPISIIITTLAGLAYEKCSNSNKEYHNPFDLMLDVLEEMPNFISHQYQSDGTLKYTIRNPALPTENFADKWHEKPMLPQAFKAWYTQVTEDLAKLLELDQGLDKTIERSREMFGSQAARGIQAKLADTLTERRAKNRAVVSSIGLGVSNAATATPVPKHNFYGDV
ncbi:nucleotidyltransferase [Vibrio aestuarianus]|uniref:Cyclic GMP-AMP synthase n=1 Tax=Vibrio aestuarianus TaxID=28171 RepID=A0AAX3U7G1_9VIBR|nr:nucleotidyltransferase [Vibrio aestuarianus]WGK83216.1 nucleotidyltransferase [Vibrio aestuarianus]